MAWKRKALFKNPDLYRMESYTIRGLRVSIADRLEINDLNDDLRSIWRRRIERWVWQHGGDSIWGHWSLHFSLSLDWKVLFSERKRRAKGFCKGGERVERELLSFWLITPLPANYSFLIFFFLKRQPLLAPLRVL